MHTTSKQMNSTNRLSKRTSPHTLFTQLYNPLSALKGQGFPAPPGRLQCFSEQFARSPLGTPTSHLRIPIPMGITVQDREAAAPVGPSDLPSHTGSSPPQPYTFKPQISFHPCLEKARVSVVNFSCKLSLRLAF